MIDTDAVVAAADLVTRCGGTVYEVGFVPRPGYDDRPDSDLRPGDVTWWASCHYRGGRISVEGHPDPVAASEALAERLLGGAGGASCAGCGLPVVLGASALTVSKVCRWERHGARWIAGCDGEHRDVCGSASRGECIGPARRRRRKRRALTAHLCTLPHHDGPHRCANCGTTWE